MVASTRTDSCRTWPIARLEFASGDTASATAVERRIREWPRVRACHRFHRRTADSRFRQARSRHRPDCISIARRYICCLPWTAVRGQQGVACATSKRSNAAHRRRRTKRQSGSEPTTGKDSAHCRTGQRQTRLGSHHAIRSVRLVSRKRSRPPIRSLSSCSASIAIPTVIIARDAGNGLSYALIERIAGQWQRRWASAYAGC